MKDEIKEILDNTLEYLEGIDETRNTKILTTNETNILLDYITNLQQEKEDYKSRCEKASEYIKSEKEHYLTKGCLIADTNNANLIVSAAVNTCDCSLNILQNGSDSQ